MEYDTGKYGEWSDEELVGMYRNGEAEVVDYLCDKYKYLVRKCARSMYILGGDTEDLIQEGMIGLFKAVREFDRSRGGSFFTFAELCVTRQIYTAVQASGRKKHIPLNEAVSLYERVGEGKENEGRFLLEELTDGTVADPENLMLDKERVAEIERVIEESLSPFEKEVWDLYLTKLSTAQIARILNREEKSTDNALQRLKGKLRKVILQENV